MSLIKIDASKLPQPVAPQVPQEVSKAQGVSVLLQTPFGETTLWAAVKTYFETEASERERELFAAITTFNRQSPLLIGLKDRFELTDEMLDQMFIEGVKVIV